MAASEATGVDVDLDPDTVRIQSVDIKGNIVDIEDDEDCVKLLKRSTGLRVTSLAETSKKDSRPSPNQPTRAGPLLLD